MLQSHDDHSISNGREYGTLQPTTFGLKIYRGDVEKWSRGNIEPYYRHPLIVSIPLSELLCSCFFFCGGKVDDDESDHR